MKKRSLLILSALLSVLMILTHCSNKYNKAPDSRWAKYIKAHSPASISRAGQFKVIFTSNLIPQSKVGKNAEDIFKITPDISGKAKWISRNKIVFLPKEKLIPGKKYIVELELNEHLKTPEKLENFFFISRVAKQNFEVKIDGLFTPNIKAPDIQELRGSILTADIEESKKVEDVLKASYQDNDLKIEWNHHKSQKKHSFIIKNIKRKKIAYTLKLAWNGDAIGVDRKNHKNIIVPAKAVFQVSNVEVVNKNRQYILLRFSDPVKRAQNLRGLIRIKNQPVRFAIRKNTIKVYPINKISGKVNLVIDVGVKNNRGNKLNNPYNKEVSFESLKPGIRFIGKGTILPDKGKVTVPVEAVSVRSFQVTAFQVYSQNMGQFLQTNKLNGKTQLTRVGRFLWRKTVHIPATKRSSNSWARYHVDVTELFKKHPNSLFRLTVSINRGNSSYQCPGEAKPFKKERPYKNIDDWKDSARSNWDTYGAYNYNYEYGGKNWSKRKDPCDNSYYNYRYNKIIVGSKNFIASNVGIIAKMGSDNRLHVITTDIRNTRSMASRIKVYNFQNQVMATGTTGANGFAEMKVDGVPFYLTAQNAGEKGYLKLNNGSNLPTSHFDVGGETVKKGGVKGHIYGERGVWRPGDNIFLTFVLQDKNRQLPENHPISIEFFNPKNQLLTSTSKYKKVGRFYAFQLKTKSNAPTGNWRVLVKVGGLSFSKSIKIETIVPNRLKIQLDIGKKTIIKEQLPLKAKISSQWLHGASADSLKCDVSVRLSRKKTRFNRFKDYTFDDITRETASDKENIFEGSLNSDGEAEFNLNLTIEDKPAGMLNANFSSRVFEEGGGFSQEVFSVPVHPYTNYVGIKTPKGDAARGMILTDKTHKVRIASLNYQSKPVSLSQVEVTLYKISWRYWYDKSKESLANFTSARGTRELQKKVIRTRKGMGIFKLKVKYPDWGRYLVRACDLDGGHCSSKVIYIDWPGWAGRARAEKGPGASRLNFSTDKKTYRVGEKAKIYLPNVPEGRALVSIENGSSVLKKFWAQTKKGKNKIELPLTQAMSPNIFVHITLIQPHKSKKNDRPIRLYGVVPILVEDPKTKLEPRITAPDEIKPMQKTIIKVGEKNKKAMTYTLAVVDEGLLGLTRFQTPKLRNVFYKREALGVKTWDLFDDIAQAFGGRLERLLAIGGGEEVQKKAKSTKKRFPPVVKFLGPFHLKAGQTRAHKIQLPQYIGSVRVMLVAGKDGAYGSAEKNVFVRQPLMILANLPRVLGPGDELNIPVNVFVTDKKVKNIQLKLKSDSFIKIVGSKSQKIRFKKPGDRIVFFKAKVASKIGNAKIKFIASSGREKAEQEINIAVRSSNPEVSKVKIASIKPGKRWRTVLRPHGLKNTNTASVEVSVIPPINLEKRLRYLIRYPHGCLEQTVSSVFPQLYLQNFLKLSDEQSKKIDLHIKAAITKLQSFQNTDGGFGYWPGKNTSNHWGSNYAGHFLVEASKKGYYVPASMLNQWRNFQKKTANSWQAYKRNAELNQAYRLFTLALNGKPELGAMNRLKESGKLNSTAKWQLAAAYILAGQKEAALDLIKKDKIRVAKYIELSNTYGSRLRDKAIILYCMTLLEKPELAKNTADNLAKKLSSNRWYSTQSTAYSLMALAKFYGNVSQKKNYKYLIKIGKKEKLVDTRSLINVTSINKIYRRGVPISIKNLNKNNRIFITLVSKGALAPGKEKGINQGIKVTAEYRTVDDEDLDVKQIKQGTDFVAWITVENPTNYTYENIALTHIIPSGWQIHNARFEGGGVLPQIDYQDIRDDRIYTYFKLGPNKTKKFKVQINASYAGKYYLPSISVEAMYNGLIQSIYQGQWVEVIR